MAGKTLQELRKKMKRRGLTLTVEATKLVNEFINSFAGKEQDALEILVDIFESAKWEGLIIDTEQVEKLLRPFRHNDSSNDNALCATKDLFKNSGLTIIDVFQVSRFCYDPIRRMFYQITEKLPIHGDASAKAALYRDRLHLLQQRLLRDKHFAPSALHIDESHSDDCELISIQSLIGCSGKKWIMGVISQLEDGHFFLEDLTAAIPIDLSQAIVTAGFVVENTIIVAEGELQSNGVFQVCSCGFPPLEDRQVSLSVTGGLDFFGGGILTSDETIRFADLEKQALDEMFVIISDVWLDNVETMERLERVLDGYNFLDIVPSLFVFMGNFCSRPCNLAFHAFSELRAHFDKLGSMIASRTNLKERSQFVFIPGPDDPGPANVLPRCALPSTFADEVRKHIPNAIFCSNPCRIKFYTQEIVLFRQDLLYRMQRSCLVPPSKEETSDPFENLVATITHQSHLCPLPLTMQPIIWNYDHCLRLYPSPHVIVLADKSEMRSFKYTDITCFNPGSFANDGSFVVYRPPTQEVEPCLSDVTD